MKGALVAVLQGIDLKRTVLLREIPQQPCSIAVRGHYFRSLWVIDELLVSVFPHPGELCRLLFCIRKVKRAGNDDTGSGQALDQRRNSNSPRIGSSVNNCSKSRDQCDEDGVKWVKNWVVTHSRVWGGGGVLPFKWKYKRHRFHLKDAIFFP